MSETTTTPPDATPATDDSQTDALLARLFSSVGDDEAAAKENPTKETTPPGGRPRSRDLHEVLADINDPPKEDAAAKKPDEKKPDAPAEKKEDAPAPVERPIRKRVRQEPPVPVAAPAPIVVAAPAPAVDDRAWEKDLLEEERDQLEAARFAEQKFPEKYKGLGDKVSKFLKEHAAKLAAPDFDQQDPRYTDWLNKNRPTLSQHEVRMIERARAKEETLAEVQESQKDLYDESFRQFTKPVVQAKGTAFFKEALLESLPDEVRAALNDPAKGVEYVKEQFPLEVDIAENITRAASDDAQTFLELTTVNPKTSRPLTAYDKNNPAHRRAIEMVRDISTDYRTEIANKPERFRNGKAYVTRLEYANLEPARRAEFWTLPDAEVLTLYRRRVKGIVGNAIKGERDRLQRYFRKPAGTPAPQDDASPPAQRPSAAHVGAPESDTSDSFLRDSLFGKPAD